MKTHETTSKTLETNQNRKKPWNYLENHENQPKTMKLRWKSKETKQKPTKNHEISLKNMNANQKPWKTMKLPWNLQL